MKIYIILKIMTMTNDYAWYDLNDAWQWQIIVPAEWLDRPKGTCSCQREQAIFEPRYTPCHQTFIFFSPLSSLNFSFPPLLSFSPFPFHFLFLFWISHGFIIQKFSPSPFPLLFPHFHFLFPPSPLSPWVEDNLYLHGGPLNSLLTTMISSQPNFWPGLD